MQEVQQKLGIRRQPPEWKKQRNEAFLKQDCSGEPVIQEDERELKANDTVDSDLVQRENNGTGY